MRCLCQGVRTQEQMQQELKYVLTIYREKKQHGKNTGKREAVLDQYSSPSEVHSWLIAKGFSEKYEDTVEQRQCVEVYKDVNCLLICRACKQLRDMTGADVFELTKRQLDHYCGATESGKLYSQITLARTETEVRDRGESIGIGSLTFLNVYRRRALARQS